MKIFYTLLSLFFLAYIINIYLKYLEKDISLSHNFQTEQIKRIDNSIDINKSSYLFRDKAWHIKRKKKKETLLEDVNQSVVKPLVLNEKEHPITICDAKECFEFLALKNNHAIFYGKKDANSSGFIELQQAQYLNKRILLQKITRKEIELYDTEFNTTLNLHMFDLNISKYKPQDTKE